jgi:transcriptional regulator with XRE-family HTH domain
MSGGRLEERVRTWVHRHTRERGERARLAAHLGRQRAWVTRYVNGQVDADLDTTAAIAAYFSVPIEALFAPGPLPPAARINDEHRALIDAWREVPASERRILRDIIDLYVRGGAARRSARARAAARTAKARGSRRTRQDA